MGMGGGDWWSCLGVWPTTERKPMAIILQDFFSVVVGKIVF
jgi:hypothetical protein